MIITPLGHTEFLVDIKNSHSENVRILVDSWLSGYCIGDLMERTVDVALTKEGIAKLDAIYISHSHADHLDPYTLVEIYKSANPLLILPFTLTYLLPLFTRYLPEAPIKILSPLEEIEIKGIKVAGHMFGQSDITNEDDVMMLSIHSKNELLFAEIDSMPEEDDINTQKELYRIFTKGGYDTVCYLASRNELEGQLKALDLAPHKRSSFRKEYILSRKEQIDFSYEKYTYEEYIDFPNIFTIPGFVRGFLGQGIAYPKDRSQELFSYQIFPLDELASLEHDRALSYGYDFPQKALQVGREYHIENGNIEVGRKECMIGKIIKKSSEITGERIYASGPLFARIEENSYDGEKRILDVLNHRLIPYWSASSVASFRDALRKSRGVYRIGCKYFLGDEIVWNVFEYQIQNSAFRSVPYTPELELHEIYWRDDILDFLDGRQDIYSNFWHSLDSSCVYRFWTCLGANFMNQDLVYKKYALHFELAMQGKISHDYYDLLQLT